MASGIEKFLKASTANLPNWVWIVVVAGGVAAAVIIPKFLGGGANTTTGTTGTSPTDQTTTNGTGATTDTGAYAYVPSGPTAGQDITALDTTNNLLQQIATAQQQILGDLTPQSTPAPTPQPTPQPAPAPTPQPAPAPTPAHYVTVQAWPAPYGSLSGIAAANGLSLAAIEGLNPQFGPSGGRNYDLIYPGEQVRIS